jgi:two-component system OmpR family response regulator
MTQALERVMLVEDDNDIRTVAGMALEMVGGLKVQACESGAQALEVVAAFAPQLVLLDVMMPGMNGPEVLQALRQRSDTAAIPVIFLTAKVQEDEIAKLRALGALDVIAKPFDPMTLAATVRALWAARPNPLT